jgi:predicted amidophosphoribosyltransferase
MSFFFLTLFVAFVIFIRVYGPALLTEFLADWEAKQALQFETRTTVPAPLSQHERAVLNAELLGAFGLSSSRELVDCTPYEWLAIDDLDSELELILVDDSLTTDQAIAALDELLRREMAART